MPDYENISEGEEKTNLLYHLHSISSLVSQVQRRHLVCDVVVDYPFDELDCRVDILMSTVLSNLRKKF